MLIKLSAEWVHLRFPTEKLRCVAKDIAPSGITLHNGAIPILFQLIWRLVAPRELRAILRFETTLLLLLGKVAGWRPAPSAIRFYAVVGCIARAHLLWDLTSPACADLPVTNGTNKYHSTVGTRSGAVRDIAQAIEEMVLKPFSVLCCAVDLQTQTLSSVEAQDKNQSNLEHIAEALLPAIRTLSPAWIRHGRLRP